MVPTDNASWSLKGHSSATVSSRECRSEPTQLTLAGVGAGPHGPAEASSKSDAWGRWSGSAGHEFQPICRVSRVPTGGALRRQPAEEQERTSAKASCASITSATNLHDALSARADRNSTMRCRKKLYDA